MAEETRSRGRENHQGASREATIMPGNAKSTQSHEPQKKQDIRNHARSRQYQDQQHDSSAQKKGKSTNRRQTPDYDRSRDSFAGDSSCIQEDGRRRKEDRTSRDSQVGRKPDPRSDKKRTRNGGKFEGVAKVMQKAPAKKSQEVTGKAEQQQLRDKEGRRKVPNRQMSDGAAVRRGESVMKEVGGTYPGKPERLEHSEEEMAEREFIFRIPMTSRSTKFPDDEFYCQACNLHLWNLGKCKNHVQQNKHRSNTKSKAELRVLKDLPNPTSAQLESITHVLTQVYHECGLYKEEDLLKRQEVFKQLTSITNMAFPGCQLKLYGSSVSGFGLRESDVNVFLQMAKDSVDDMPTVLKRLLVEIKNHTDLYIDVQPKFDQTIPVITFVHHQSCLLCDICVGKEKKDVLIATLLHHYASLDKRAAVLGICLRKWGQLCRLDDPLVGTLPAVAFPLMVIFFLQQVKPPVLPVLQEPVTKSEALASSETPVEGSSDDGNGEEKVNEDEEEEMGEETSDNLTIEDIKAMKLENWKSDNDESIGSLWLKMLKYYVIDNDIEQMLVCISKQGLISRTSVAIPNRRLAIADPLVPKRNMASGLNSQTVFNFFMMRVRQCLLYFNTAKPSGDLAADLSAPTAPAGSSDDDKELDLLASQLVEHAINSALKSLCGNSAAIPSVLSQMSETDGSCDGPKHLSLSFKFDVSVLCDKDRPLPEWCCLCRQDGHLSVNCVDDASLNLPLLPKMSSQLRALLDRVCLDVRGDLAATKKEEDQKKLVLCEIHEFVSHEYPECNLTLFGSSENGFGFRNSDMDICLTHPLKTLDAVEVVTKLAQGMRTRKQEYREVLAIPSAKVPIVKFVHVASGMEGDISLDNILMVGAWSWKHDTALPILYCDSLAQRNTRMLRFYSELDDRVKTLGYVIKCFAKITDIGDAARGSLSSYAYIIMLLYYLQQTNPPVIPCLQEMYEGEGAPCVECEGWNCYYCSDLEFVQRLWGETENRQSVGELWLGLLRFYTEEFDWKKMVVSPRQLKPLSKFDKSWTGKSMAIEDPFKLSHNLASGVGRKMRNFILECFALARLQFGKQKHIPQDRYLPNVFFNRRYLTPHLFSPNDRSCRNCGEFGHYAKDCHNQGGKTKGQSRQVVTYSQLQRECAPPSMARAGHPASHSHGQAGSHCQNVAAPIVRQPFPPQPVSSHGQAGSHCQNVAAPIVRQPFPPQPVSSQQLHVHPVVSTPHPVVYRTEQSRLPSHSHGQAVSMTRQAGSHPQNVAVPVRQPFPPQPVSSQQLNVRPVASYPNPVVHKPEQRQPIASQSGLKPVVQHQTGNPQLNLRKSVASQPNPAVPVAVSQQSAAFTGSTHQGSRNPIVSQHGHHNQLVTQHQHQQPKPKEKVQAPVVTSSLPRAPPVTVPQHTVAHSPEAATQYLQSLLGVCAHPAHPAQQQTQQSHSAAAQADDRIAIQQPCHPTYSSHSGNTHSSGPTTTASSTRRGDVPGPQLVEYLNSWYAFYRHQLTILHSQEQHIMQMEGDPRKQEYLQNIHAWQTYYKQCMDACQRECQILQTQDNEPPPGVPTSPGHVGLPRLSGTSFGRKQ